MYTSPEDSFIDGNGGEEWPFKSRYTLHSSEGCFFFFFFTVLYVKISKVDVYVYADTFLTAMCTY